MGAVLRGELQTELQQGEDEPEVRTGELRAGGALWWGLQQVVFLRGNLFSTYVGTDLFLSMLETEFMNEPSLGARR